MEEVIKAGPKKQIPWTYKPRPYKKLVSVQNKLEYE